MDKSSYRQVFKATSIFGGVQVFNILISLIRSKFIAILLGPAGTGYMGLLNAPIGFINTLTGLGIDYSAIRDISAANESGDKKELSKTLVVFRRWVWITGCLGMFVVLFLAPWLSEFTFGDKTQTIPFIILSVTLLITSISGGQSAILRGTRRIKETAKAGIWGSVVGLVTSIPLYYWLGMKGIVPSLIIAAFTGLFFSWFYSRKIKTEKVSVSTKETFSQGKQMIRLGVMMTLNGIIGSGISYLIIAFIGSQGGMEDVGLYNAGWSITNQYVGLVFAAMGADYYPKLAGIHKDNNKVREAVNQQAEISVLIVAPIMLIYLLSLPVLIHILYSKEYLDIIPFTQWVVLGMLFKTVSWAMGFIILSKGDTKLFFCTELTANALLLILNITGYHLYGLEGIGISFVALYLFYFFFIWMICKRKYEFFFYKNFYKPFLLGLLFSFLAFISVYYFNNLYGYISAFIIAVLTFLYSYKQLDKRLDIKGILNKKFNK